MAKLLLPNVDDTFECDICGSEIYFCSEPFTYECIGAICFGFEAVHVYFQGVHFNSHVRHFNKYILPGLYGQSKEQYHKPHLMNLINN